VCFHAFGNRVKHWLVISISYWSSNADTSLGSRTTSHGSSQSLGTVVVSSLPDTSHPLNHGCTFFSLLAYLLCPHLVCLKVSGIA
jgi:hypothetical protein